MVELRFTVVVVCLRLPLTGALVICLHMFTATQKSQLVLSVVVCRRCLHFFRHLRDCLSGKMSPAIDATVERRAISSSTRRLRPDGVGDLEMLDAAHLPCESCSLGGDER